MEETKVDLANLTVEEFTSVDPVVLSQGATVGEAKKLMKNHGIRHLPIMDGQRAVGLVTERMLAPFPDTEMAPIEGVMIEDPFVVRSQDLLKEVVFEMSSRKIGSALVTGPDGRTLYGIFTSIDALNAIIELF